jgi:hypothetical protein
LTSADMPAAFAARVSACFLIHLVSICLWDIGPKMDAASSSGMEIVWYPAGAGALVTWARPYARSRRMTSISSAARSRISSLAPLGLITCSNCFTNLGSELAIDVAE